jgi:hypothetical protein
LLDTNELDIDTVYDTSAGAINTWQRFEVDAFAPPGTTTVRVRIAMLDGLLQPANPQSGFVDTLELLGPVGTVVAIPTLSSLWTGLLVFLLVALAWRTLRSSDATRPTGGES